VVNERQRRIGENEAVFRRVNELVRPVEPTWMTILCECGDSACRDHIVIDQDAYSRVREQPTLFLVRPGHEFLETEVVVSKQLEYWTVEKRPGLPAGIAQATNPNES
jgi:hypothetical protein